MYEISTYDIQTIDTKLELQRKYICSRFFDFGDETKSAIEFTYSANLNPKKYFAEMNNRINSIVLRRHYNGVTQERLDLRREEMLSVSINDIREVGQELTTAMENIVMSTVSDQTSIEKSELFKNIIVVK